MSYEPTAVSQDLRRFIARRQGTGRILIVPFELAANCNWRPLATAWWLPLRDITGGADLADDANLCS